MAHTHTMEYFQPQKNNEVLPLATILRDIEGVMLNDINQTEEVKYHVISPTCGI